MCSTNHETHKPVNSEQDTSWDHADNWEDTDWSTNVWRTDLLDDLAWEQAARLAVLPQSSQGQPELVQGGQHSTAKGPVHVRVLSVGDEMLQDAHERRAGWNEHEFTDGGCWMVSKNEPEFEQLLEQQM